ncbi:single-stranded DNA-binding protein [Providencia manganoxydans]
MQLDKGEQPYSAGFYTLDDSSFTVRDLNYLKIINPVKIRFLIWRSRLK